MVDDPQLRICGVAQRGTFTLDVDVVADSRELLVIVGPNGAGKSTLFEVIAGLTPLSHGMVTFGEHTWESTEDGQWMAPRERCVGVVFQDLRLFPHLSVLDNVAFGRRARGESKATARRLAQVALDRVDLGHVARTQPARLSGGQAQRVAIARVLVSDPNVLLFDEPFAASDVATRASMRALLCNVAADFAGPCIFVTHDPFEALSMADRVVVLERGRVAQEGTVAEIRRRPRSRYVADLLGSNVFNGVVRGSTVVTDVGVKLAVVPSDVDGKVCAVIEPRSVSLHASRPDTSARNVWQMNVTMIDDDGGGRVRVQLDGAFELAAEITEAACRELALAPGVVAWASVKATEIRVEVL